MAVIKASELIPGRGFPTDEGRTLAGEALKVPPPWDGLEVDLRGMPPSLLIGGFFFAFLQTVHDRSPDRLAEARRIRWLLDYDFQEQYVSDWMKSFKPN